MRTLRFEQLTGYCAPAASLLLAAALSAATVGYAAEPKKSAPAPAAHPAAAPARPAAPAAPHAPGAAGGAAAGHGPTTSSPTTTHGPTTSGATANHITTTSPGGNHVTTASPGAKPGGAPGVHPTAAPGGHTTSAASTFHGHPAPTGSHETHAPNGTAVRTRADGSRSDVHDPKRGMDIHHGLDGNRRSVVERPDHSRVVAERGGRGYVQHPYMHNGHEFGHRTYYDHGRAYDRYYGRYPYGGGYLNVYAPARFYPVGFYGYVYSPWAAPVPYAWGWGGAPWYGYYGAYYAPYPVYPAPAFWLADFVIAASLQAAFIAAASADIGPIVPQPSNFSFVARWVADHLIDPAQADAKSGPTMSPDVKNLVADEIKAMVQAESEEAQANAAKQDPDPAKSSVTQLLGDNRGHVFVGGTDIDLVNSAGQECLFTQGDVMKVSAPPVSGADTLDASVIASKGGKECALSSTVKVSVSDVQDMRNHMQEQIDSGLTELQSKQGKNGIPAAPASAAGPAVPAAFTEGAPPPDATAAEQIKQQASDADKAEQEASAAVATAPSGTAGTSTSISMGQSIESVTGSLGAPTRIIDLGAKKIYTYPDMKITFVNGKVADVE